MKRIAFSERGGGCRYLLCQMGRSHWFNTVPIKLHVD